MIARILFPGVMTLVLLPSTALAHEGEAQQPPHNRNELVLGLNQIGISFRLNEAEFSTAHNIPYPSLMVPQVAFFCTRIVSMYLNNEDADAVDNSVSIQNDQEADSGLEHLFKIAQRCERDGDTDMACNCYTEIVRMRPNSTLAAAAKIHRRRLLTVTTRMRTQAPEGSAQRGAGKD